MKNPMLEPEYIDRKKLLDKQKNIDGEPYVRLWDVLMAPVEDVEPVVRCKVCKWFDEVVGKGSGKPCGYGACRRPLSMKSIIVADDFCSYGERKDNDRKTD